MIRQAFPDLDDMLRQQAAVPESELHAAVRRGDLAAVEELLSCAGDGAEALLSERAYMERTPLHEAILLGNGERGGNEKCIAMVELLLKRSQRSHLLAVDAQRKNALHYACIRKIAPVVEMVLQMMPPEGLTPPDLLDRTPAMVAVDMTANPHCIRPSALEVTKLMPWEALIAQGASFGENAVLNAVLRYGDDILPHILSIAPEEHDLSFEPVRTEHDGVTILHCYVSSTRQSLEGLTVLLRRVPRSMAIVTSGGNTPLHYASRNCTNSDIVKILLELMAPEDCDIRNCVKGHTALHCATRGSTALLIAQHMRQSALGILDNNGNTPLVELLSVGEVGDLEVTALWLVCHMSVKDLTVANCKGVTAFHLALLHRMYGVAEKLVELLPEDAILARDIAGNNALHYCLNFRVIDARTDVDPTAKLLELLLHCLPREYRTMQNDEGESPAELAEDLDEDRGYNFSKYFMATAKGAIC